MSLGGVAMAQSNSTGTIFGSAGTPGSTVHVQNVDTGFSRDIQADQNGRYRASSLPIGNYKVTLMQDGQEVSSRNVTLQVGGGVDASRSEEHTSELQSLMRT